MATQSLLDRLEQLCNVDVDDVDTEVIRSLPFTPHNRKFKQKIHAAALNSPASIGQRLPTRPSSRGRC
jgi:transaldolase